MLVASSAFATETPNCFSLQFSDPPAYIKCMTEMEFAVFKRRFGRDPAVPGNACIHFPPGPQRQKCAAALAETIARVRALGQAPVAVSPIPTAPTPPPEECPVVIDTYGNPIRRCPNFCTSKTGC